MHRTLFTSTLTIALALSPAASALAQACSKQSPAHTVALLELYTSEGCSSCPPADKFLSNLRTSGMLREKVVPLSLHVDYWDYIGWKDRFGNSEFAARQRWLATLAKSKAVYTPEMFMSGVELRNWRGGVPDAVNLIALRPARADIAVTLGKAVGGKLPLDISVKTAQPVNLFVALFENDIASEVKFGENGGRTLRHDYVVRDWIGPIAMSANDAGAKAALPRLFRIPYDSVPKNLGVATFVQAANGEVLQALSIPFCGM